MEEMRRINGWLIYKGGTWCEVTDENDNYIYDGSVDPELTLEEIYNILIQEINKNFLKTIDNYD